MHLVLAMMLAIAASSSPPQDCDATAASILAKSQLATQHQIGAHKDGNVEQEIIALRDLIDDDIEMSKHCAKSGKYNLYLSAFERTSLAIYLAGQKQTSEAEEAFRRADADYKTSGVAGDDTYSENDLPFAYLLRREGKTAESARICGYWKGKVARLGRNAVSMAKNSDPQISPYDTPEQQIGRWSLFCEDEKNGIAMLTAQSTAHPQMLAPVATLGEYYAINGDFQKAHELETTWHERLGKL